MSVPAFHALLKPVLEALTASKNPVPRRELAEAVTAAAGLKPADLAERLSSGQSRFRNRFDWAVYYLRRAGLVKALEDTSLEITAEGRKFLSEAKGTVSVGDLRRYPSFVEFERGGSSKAAGTATEQAASERTEETPEDRIQQAEDEIRRTVGAELIAELGRRSPTLFEKVVLDLLNAMGYADKGGRVEHTGRSGDGGIDGIVHLDRLGLDKVYVQAKRYKSGSVGPEEVQAFFGALKGRRADKGVLITTSTFTEAARKFATSVSDSLVLVDGSRLAELMIDNEIGVAVRHRVSIPHIDRDYFEE